MGKCRHFFVELFDCDQSLYTVYWKQLTYLTIVIGCFQDIRIYVKVHRTYTDILQKNIYFLTISLFYSLSPVYKSG